MRRPLFPAPLSAALGFLLLIALCFPAPAPAVVLDRIVALVNNEAITWLELYKAMERELATSLKGQRENERRETLAAKETGFLESMVLRKLQLQEAVRQDIFVSEQEVEATIESIRSKYGLGPDEFTKVVEDSGADWPEYRLNLREQIVIQKLVDKVVRSRLEGGEGESSGMESKLHLKQIFLKGDREEAELLGLVQSVYDALDSGGEFDAVALRMSEGPNASTGGDLGMVEESSLSEQMRLALRGVASGQVAPPVKSEKGVHIIKIESKVSGDGKDRETQFQKAYEKWMKSLRDNARIDIRL